MDKNEKLIQLMDMLDNPWKYEEEQIEEMLKDSECRKYYDTMANVKDAIMHKNGNITEKETGEEWRRFEKTYLNTHRGFSLRKLAAAVAVTAVLGGISYATIHISRSENRQKKTERAETAVTFEREDTLETAGTAVAAEKKDVRTYDNVRLCSILDDIAAGYGLDVHYENKQSKELRLFFRWNPQDTLRQVINSLNDFERINIRMDEKTLTVE